MSRISVPPVDMAQATTTTNTTTTATGTEPGSSPLGTAPEPKPLTPNARWRIAEGRLKRAEARIAKLEEALARQRQAANAAQERVVKLEAKLVRFQSGVRYRTGAAVIASTKSFGGFLRLPRELRAIYRDHKSKQQASKD